MGPIIWDAEQRSRLERHVMSNEEAIALGTFIDGLRADIYRLQQQATEPRLVTRYLSSDRLHVHGDVAYEINNFSGACEGCLAAAIEADVTKKPRRPSFMQLGKGGG